MPRTALILALAAAFLVPVSAPAAAAPPGDGASASAKKKAKKCKKGYKRVTVKVKKRGKTVRVKKCRKPPKRKSGGGGGQEDANATARQLLTDAEFYRPFATQYTSGDEIWRFCSNGRYFRRYASSGTVTSDTYDGGTWQFLEGKFVTANGQENLLGAVRLTGTYDGSQVDGKLIAGWKRGSYQQTGISVDNGQSVKEYIRRSPTGGC